MKTFTFYYDSDSCPIARSIERAVNNCNSPTENLKAIRNLPDSDGNIMLNDDNLRRFIIACILYWAQTERYDGRNIYAVLHAREIAKHFTLLSKIEIPDDILKEAYGFTCCAHRYLQNEFFKVILKYMETDIPEITDWLDKQNFVYNDKQDGLIPYEEYKTDHQFDCSQKGART